MSSGDAGTIDAVLLVVLVIRTKIVMATDLNPKVDNMFRIYGSLRSLSVGLSMFGDNYCEPCMWKLSQWDATATISLIPAVAEQCRPGIGNRVPSGGTTLQKNRSIK